MYQNNIKSSSRVIDEVLKYRGGNNESSEPSGERSFMETLGSLSKVSSRFTFIFEQDLL